MTVKTKDPRPAEPPTWQEYWATVGNEDWLYARELIELSPSVRAHFGAFVEWRDDPVWVDDPDDPGMSMPDPEGWVWRDSALDWEAAAAAADDWAASSTERRLLRLVLSLVQPGEGERTLNARELGSMGSWADDVADILSRYILGVPPRK